MKKVKIIVNDEAMNNLEEVIDMERVEPRIIKGNEPTILTGKDDSGNAIGIFDEFCGADGQYVTEGNFKEYYDVAMKNLNNHYYLNDFEFENIMETQVFKFDCPNFTRTAKSIMLLESFQKAVEDSVGEEAYYIVSERGNLYVSSKGKNHKDVITSILDFDKAWLDNEFVFYTIDKNGKYNEERSFSRG